MANRTPAVLAVMLLALACWPLGDTAHAQKKQPLAVVVGTALQMNEITLSMLRRIFQGETVNAPDGKRFVPVNAPLNSYERELFDRKVLGLAPDEVSRFWINRRIRDEGLPPRTLPSVELGVRVAASYPGAIAYVSMNLVAKGVHILKVDGKLPNEAGYTLAP